MLYINIILNYFCLWDYDFNFKNIHDLTEYIAHCFSVVNQNQWHQVEFMTAKNLSGILTQGSPNADKWVSSFTVSTSLDGYTFYPVRDNGGNTIVFSGNSDKDSVITNFFPRVSFTEFLYILTELPQIMQLLINL